MPELPEVELVAQSLNRLVAKRKIVRAELLRERLAAPTSAATFAVFLQNVTIESVGRRGKHILFYFDANKALVAHLRMTGRFLLLPAEREIPKHTHAIFYLENSSKLVFQDQRHFGMMKIADRDQVFELEELKRLAPEPLSEDFSLKYFTRVLQNSGRTIKEVLLDQTKICGLGNIYAAEAMFLARVNPHLAASKISRKRAQNLFEAIRFVLSESIALGSTMNVDPENIDASYNGGVYENHWRVYDQENKNCGQCQNSIKRIVQNQRSTFFCPVCQRR